MKILAWLGQIITWLGALALCLGVISGSALALLSLAAGSAELATERPSRFVASAPVPLLASEAFDVRKVATFLDGSSRAEPFGENVELSIPETFPPTSASTVVGSLSVQVGDTAVNLRAGPKKSAQRITTLQPGESVTLLGKNGNWAEVATSAGHHGWVFAKYLVGVSTEV